MMKLNILVTTFLIFSSRPSVGDLKSSVLREFDNQSKTISILAIAKSKLIEASVVYVTDKSKTLLVVTELKDKDSRLIQLPVELTDTVKLKLEIAMTSNHKNLIAVDDSHQTQIFEFISGKLLHFGDLALTNIQFEPDSQSAEKVRGEKILTFCDLCDEVADSDTKDIISIPQEAGLTDKIQPPHCLLKTKEIKQLQATFKKRTKRNKKKAFWASHAYLKFLSKLQSDFNAALK
jgi:hypothetical protein